MLLTCVVDGCRERVEIDCSILLVAGLYTTQHHAAASASSAVGQAAAFYRQAGYICRSVVSRRQDG